MVIAPPASPAAGAIDEAASSGDPVTSDFLTEITRAADQALWKLESPNERA
jgi:DNA-binding ferritin-like protein